MRLFFAISLLLLMPLLSSAQISDDFNQNTLGSSLQDDADDYVEDENGNYVRKSALKKKDAKQWGRDTTGVDKSVPIGIFQWTIDERLGDTIHAENIDTVVHQFSSFNNVDGYNGEYSHIGNVGSPRLSRIFLNRAETKQSFFIQPFDFFIQPLRDFRFSNTLSPITNLAYHKAGSTQTGQDRIRANFAKNINRISGIGFLLDYLYGRGCYNNQANSQFGGSIFGYYAGERYNMHAYINANHSKLSENGAIENDEYITNPTSFPQSYGSRDIPTNFDETWNRNDNQTFFLTHRYNAGRYVQRDIPQDKLPKMPADEEFLTQLSDSVRTLLLTDSLRRSLVLDSLRTRWQNAIVIPRDFIPVMSFIHTLHIDRVQHTFYSYDNTNYDSPSSSSSDNSYYANHYYGPESNVTDRSCLNSVRNTVGLQLREGFNKWAKMGISLFATHELRRATLPDSVAGRMDTTGICRYTENNLSVGGVIAKTQGSLIHYNASGEVWLLGADAGQFKVEGQGDLNLRFRRDTLQLRVHAYIKNLKPTFFYRHYHSQFTWWDNTGLDQELRERIEGWLSLRRTRTSLRVGFENINNYTYLAMHNTLKSGRTPSTLVGDYRHAIAVEQAASGIQVFSATLRQDFKAGPLHWDNELTFQKSTNSDLLPLPAFNAYSNLYLVFRIAKVLRVQLGGDIRFFTRYYAPDYYANIQQFAIQDASNERVKCGNYPIVNVYANLHIKHCRIYAAVNHVNAGNGRYFLTPHHPIDPLTIHFGVSWNFFN